MLYMGLAVAMLFCAAMAIRAKHLLTSVLWLAGVSALLSLIFYLLGAKQIAVIELSVGAGLITVLMVFAISVVGDQPIEARSIIPLPVAIVLIAAAFIMLLILTIPAPAPIPGGEVTSFAEVLWQDRGLDVLVQVLLIFSGVLGVLGVLAHRIQLTRRSAGQSAIKEAGK